MRLKIAIVFILLCSFYGRAQHCFKGYIDNERWQNEVYLSVIDDYRTISGIHEEQIISRVDTDSTGFFQFNGNQLETTNKIYKLHVDNCSSFSQNPNHFDGNCNDSKNILFIAKSNDTIMFPLSFDDEMFCTISSTNTKTAAFVKIDSIKEVMKYAYGEFRSEANRKLNNKKWFKTLHQYSKDLNEPLAELYAYAFVSDRSNNLHEYYLEDLKTNTYYDNLLERLNTYYPNSPYTIQYRNELASDKYIVFNNRDRFNWLPISLILLVISLLANFYFGFKLKKRSSKQRQKQIEQLTNQEQNILNLLLDHKTNKEIAEALFVSVSTVKTHVNNIYKKLNVQSREEIKKLFIK